MEISLMSSADYDEAFSLWTGTEGMGLRSLDDSREGISSFLRRNPGTSYICRAEGRIIGTILCGHDGRRGSIYHAVVHEDFRRQGIGEKLVEKALSSLDKEGIRKAGLVCFADNEKGNEFWETLGFSKRDDLIYRNRVIDPHND